VSSAGDTETGPVPHPSGNAPTLLDDRQAADRQVLDRLRADPRIEFVDQLDRQRATLHRLLPAPSPDLLAEPERWVYYPWRRTVVRMLGPRAYRRTRLDRNRNLITTDEQDRLATLRVGVVGLSVGHAIAHTLAAQGLGGQLRLADFDHLELSNLNRVPATVFDLGENKAVVAARRIAELDPYLDVQIVPDGLTAATIGPFLDGLDILIEECDSLDIKALVREAARARAVPVLMATSDRGLLDVERFDIDPQRPIFHGLLAGVDAQFLAGLSNRDKVPYVLRVLEAPSLSARGAASLVEVGHTLATWPQLAGDVSVGAAAVATAVQRIGLGLPLESGRIRLDVAEHLDRLRPPVPPTADEPLAAPTDEPLDGMRAIAAAAVRAPSGGNVQPWRMTVADQALTISLDPHRSTTMDVGLRASAVAVGAAAFNARVAAAAAGRRAEVQIAETGPAPLTAVVAVGDGTEPELAGLHEAMLRRETNRRLGSGGPVDPDTLDALVSTAREQGGDLRLLTDRAAIEEAGAILGAADRVRYLSPRLHAEMTSELRWPAGPDPDAGIDVHSLELGAGGLLTLDVLRRPEVMALLGHWDAGDALAQDTQERTASSSALAVVTMRGRSLTDYARGGQALEAVWIAAQQRGMAVQPVSPVFLYARSEDEVAGLAPFFAPALRELSDRFRRLVGLAADEAPVLVLRLSDAAPASVRSRRRAVDELHPALPLSENV
jgi:molybdopterin/thiamine biosynthesis adenylyltransferase